jgi:glutamine synthetase
MNSVEIKSRQEILFENYSKIINIEALTMIEMATRDIIPAVNKYVSELANTAALKMQVVENVNCMIERDLISKLSSLNAKAYMTVGELKKVETEAATTECFVTRAELYANKVLPVMEKLRAYVDEMETMTASEFWPMPNYGDMMFKV